MFGVCACVRERVRGRALYFVKACLNCCGSIMAASVFGSKFYSFIVVGKKSYFIKGRFQWTRIDGR